MRRSTANAETEAHDTTGRGGRNLYEAASRKTARGFVYENSGSNRGLTPARLIDGHKGGVSCGKGWNPSRRQTCPGR